MKNNLITLVIIILIASPEVMGQQKVTVFDRQNGNPVENVLIFNLPKTATALTGANGTALLKGFKENDTLLFQHPAFHNRTLPFSKLKSLSFKVALDENFIDLEEVVVSANRYEQKKSEIPNRILVVKPRDIAFNNPATTADMLTQSGQVFVQKSQLGGGSPMIRGFAANRILFVLDGVRMNNAIYRSGNLQNILQADVNSISGTEVIFGPGTNIYGSDALGGVMDIHLKDPETGSTEEWLSKGTIWAGLASAAFEKKLHVRINIANNQMAFLTMITFNGFDDLRMGKQGVPQKFLRNYYVDNLYGTDTIVPNDNPYVQRYSGYNQWNFTQKFKYIFNSGNSLNMGLYYSSTGDVPRYDRLTQEKNGKPKYAEWYYKPQSWLMFRTALNLHNKKTVYDNGKITFALQQVGEGRNDRKYRNPWLRQRVEKVGIASLNAAFDKKAGKNNFFYYGIEAVYNRVNSTAKKENIDTDDTKAAATRYPDGGTGYFHSGIYLSFKHDINRAPVNLLAGIRYSYTLLKSRFNDTSWYHLPFTEVSLSNGALTGNAGVVYHPGQWNFRFNLSSGFRAPNLDDVAKIFDSEPGNVVVPNQNLKPEYLYNAEAGLSRTFRDKARIEAGAFYSYLVNAMVRGDFQLNGQDSIMYDGEMSKVEAVVNTGWAKIYGWNASLYLQLWENLGFKAAYNYIRGFDDKGNAVRHVSPSFGEVQVTYEKKKLKLGAGTYFNGAIGYDRLAPSERKKKWMYAEDDNGNPYAPAWLIFNIKASYAFSRNFYVSGGVENILDTWYRPYSSGISGPGRNFVFSMKYNF